MLRVRLPLVRSRRDVRWAVAVLALVGGLVSVGGAAEARPVVGPGATRAEALNAYGWPTGQSQSGTREIFTYPQGRIYLENGRVERVDFSPTVTWAAPRARPAPPTATAGKKTETVDEYWTTDFAAAGLEAERRHARVLAVFTGSDWSPASRQFDEEVAWDQEFINTFLADYVFLKVDFPSRKQLPEALREQNAKLRERYEVTTYPAMVVLSPSGVLLAKVDLDSLPAGESYRARIIAALRTVRGELAAKFSASGPAGATALAGTKPSATATTPASGREAGGAGSSAPAELGASLSSAGWLLLTSLAGGAVFVGGVLWWLWRRTPAVDTLGAPAPTTPAEAPVTGMPALANATGWSKQQLLVVTTKLVEAEGFKAEPRPPGGDVDLAISRAGEISARALVVCVPAMAGRVTTKRVRELLASVTLEGAAEGWLVAPGGLAPEARAFAHEKGISMIDAAALSERFAALPPLARGRLMGGATG